MISFAHLVQSNDNTVHIVLHGPPDVLRFLVLLEILIMLMLEVHALGRVMQGLRRDAKDSPLRAFRWGRLARFIGLLAACLVFVYNTLHRMGQPTLDMRTPMAQVALIGFLLSYYLVDRRNYRSAEQALDQLLRDVQHKK